MQKLKQANLYRSELIPVSGKLVERYNECLYTLGFEKTKLKTFLIDGMGWSPDIAEEKNNVNYLNHGEANPHGIILTPRQKGKPIYTPFHSFDREMMKFIFKTYETKINDITRDSAICLDFDQDIDTFYEPLDVLRYDEINIGFRLINDLNKRQAEQLELVHKFNSGNNFIDETIHQELLDSANTYGDLRHRDLSLPSLKFDVSTFYTRAYGGVYVLRDFIMDIVIFENEEVYKMAIRDTTYDVMIFHIKQPELVKKLRDHAIIDCNLGKVINTRRYNRIKKFELAQHVKESTHPISEILDNKALFKSYLNRIDVHGLKKVTGVEMYIERMERSNTFKIQDLVDMEMYYALHEPHSSLEAKFHDIIWQLIVNVAPKDVLFMYWYDKESFYKNYETWDESLKDWVINTIKNNI